MLPFPSETNGHLANHVQLLRSSLRRLTGRDLTEADLAPEEAARQIFHAPFALLSHDAAANPVLTYGNLATLSLFELNWEELTSMPSCRTAEAPQREERERLLAQVAVRGFIDDYAGVRISRTGRRFRIEKATIWNLVDEAGRMVGQAAMLSRWTML